MSTRPIPSVGQAASPFDLSDLLDLKQIDEDHFQTTAITDDPGFLYGGQVAAQALLAAGLTVEDERRPHSLHGYFLRAGDAAVPTVLQVHRDRDGRSFSARRVVALQNDKVIFSASMSFQVAADGLDDQVTAAPDAPTPDECTPIWLASLTSFESRGPGDHPRPPAGADPRDHDDLLPTLFWARCTLPDLSATALLDACAITYLSDISSGLAPFIRPGWGLGPSLDHALWFHEPQVSSGWLLTHLEPIRTHGGRGTYSGQIYDESGRLVASLAQEALLRRRR